MQGTMSIEFKTKLSAVGETPVEVPAMVYFGTEEGVLQLILNHNNRHMQTVHLNPCDMSRLADVLRNFSNSMYSQINGIGQAEVPMTLNAPEEPRGY